MPYVRQVNKAKWYRDPELPWLQPGQVPADALSDLKTSDNELSVFYTDGNKSSIEQIAVAMTTTKDDIHNFDYAILHEEDIDQLNVRVVSKPGKTAHDAVNSWHRDFIELTGQKLLDLAGVILARGEIQRVLPKQVCQLMARAMVSGQIDRSKVKLKPDELAKIDRYNSQMDRLESSS